MQLLCDICQSPNSVDTVRFGWNLVNYEIDLCPEHSEELSAVVERAIGSARRLGAPASSGRVSPPSSLPSRAQATTAEVRAWAKKNDIDVNPRGRLPDELFDRYLAETRSS